MGKKFVPLILVFNSKARSQFRSECKKNGNEVRRLHRPFKGRKYGRRGGENCIRRGENAF